VRPRLLYQIPVYKRGQQSTSSLCARASRFITLETCHLAPRGVGILRSFSACVIAPTRAAAGCIHAQPKFAEDGMCAQELRHGTVGMRNLLIVESTPHLPGEFGLGQASYSYLHRQDLTGKRLRFLLSHTEAVACRGDVKGVKARSAKRATCRALDR
jgi:hypothetical protein